MNVLKYRYYTKYLPLILFFGLIVIDSINGYAQANLGTYYPIGVISRGLIMLSIIPYTLKNDLKYASFFRLLAVLYVSFIPLWYISGTGINIGMEMQNIFKFVYFFTILMYFQHYKNCFSPDWICRIISLTAMVLAIINIYCAITGSGNKSYGEDFGFGTKAFYADGNSFGLYMILSNCISVWYAFYKKHWWFLVAVIVSLGTLLVGSRTAMAGVVLTWALLLFYFLIKKDRMVRLPAFSKLSICLIGGGCVGYMLVKMIQFISTFDTYTLTKFTLESAISSREHLILLGTQVIRNFNFMELFIGKSYSGGMRVVGAMYASDVEFKSMETDWLDMILYYGWGFGVLMIVLQLLIFKNLVTPFIKSKSSLNFTLLIIAMLWMGTSWMAGHAFNNTMLAPLFAVLLLLSDNKYDTRRIK